MIKHLKTQHSFVFVDPSYYKRDVGVNADSYEDIYAVVDSIYKSFYAPINAEVPSVVVDEYDLFDNEPSVDE